MSRSFFPLTDSLLAVWAANYKAKIGNFAGLLGLTPEKVAAEQANCDAIIESVNNVSDKRGQLKGAIEARKAIIASEGGALRAEIGRHKTAVNFTDAIGEELGIKTHAPTVDFANYKAKITVELYGGIVRIKFKKMYADGINIYRRKKGALEWLYVARATKNPFDHNFSLQVAGQPEHWEYRAFGVVDDSEVGVPSDIVEIIYGV